MPRTPLSVKRNITQWVAEALEGLLFRLFSPLLLCRYGTRQQRLSLSTSGLSNEEIKELAESSPKVDEGTYFIPELRSTNLGHVAKIASDVVVKSSFTTGQHEQLSAELVRRYTAIPVPRHERVFRDGFKCYLVQQFVPGHVLADAWPQLNSWTRLRTYVTLRYYIRELRAISSRSDPPPFPGPPSINGGPQRCTGRLFTEDGSGPFLSYRDMSRWYQNRLLVMQKFRKEGLDTAPFDDTAPLVFTHMDFHPRNVILGSDGQLWVIDWTNAGWYPTWFEAASMVLFARHRPDIPSSWTSWIPFVAGSCGNDGQLPFLEAISYTLVVYRSDIINLIDDD